MGKRKMASFLTCVAPVICGLQILLILGTGISTEAAATVTDPCPALMPKKDLNVTDIGGLLHACRACVVNQTNHCAFINEVEGFACRQFATQSQFTRNISRSFVECDTEYVADNTTTTTPTPPVTTTTTTTTSTTTTTTTTTTPPPPTNITTTTTTTPKPPTVPTTTTTTTTPAPPTPQSGGFSFANFFGGIIFTLAVSSLGYVAWRFYRARNPNYHTF